MIKKNNLVTSDDFNLFQSWYPGKSREEVYEMMRTEVLKALESAERDSFNIAYLCIKYKTAIYPLGADDIYKKEFMHMLEHPEYLKLNKDYKLLWHLIFNECHSKGYWKENLAILNKLLDTDFTRKGIKDNLGRWFELKDNKYSIKGFETIPKANLSFDEPWRKLKAYPELWDRLGSKFKKMPKSELNRYTMACSNKIATEYSDWNKWSGTILYRRFEQYLTTVNSN